ncbi:hypothetical protein ON010_g14473 [Phytophthora cinnamomi]|nr:hypothetical protein ON010_g14473 [Phytophthora cinnamomi]
MADPTTKTQSMFGNARFVLDAFDVDAAVALGLLRRDVAIETSDPTSSKYGVAYNQRRNIAGIVFPSQQAAKSGRMKRSRVFTLVPFLPWATTVSLAIDKTIRVPAIAAAPERLGKRGLKSEPRPKHSRKQEGKKTLCKW